MDLCQTRRFPQRIMEIYLQGKQRSMAQIQPQRLSCFYWVSVLYCRFSDQVLNNKPNRGIRRGQGRILSSGVIVQHIGRKTKTALFFGRKVCYNAFATRNDRLLGGTPMDKFIPYEKLSKKKKRELDAARRGSWTMNPVTRRPPNPKAYNRRQARKWRDDSASVPAAFIGLSLCFPPVCDKITKTCTGGAAR